MSTTPACPVRGVCLSPGPCANAAACILELAPPLILTPMTDWRAAPFPWPLRADSKPRAGLPEVFA